MKSVVGFCDTSNLSKEEATMIDEALGCKRGEINNGQNGEAGNDPA